jgi:exodeoxyribonuclease V alpha subunit
MEISGGKVISVPFHNEDNGFSVIKVQFSDIVQPITCIGTMPSIAPGREISVSGHWQSNHKFGKQFVVEHYSFSTPATKEGIISFLSSGALPSIGPARARQIYNLFGSETLSVLDQLPERLMEIPGIGKKTVKKIKEKWQQDEQIRKLLLFLQQFDVSYSTAIKIFKAYGVRAQEKISKNPYALCEDIWGIGFLKADQIARHMNFSHDSYKRIKAGIFHIMNEASQEGHTCLLADELKSRAVELLKINEERLVFSLDHTLSVNMLIIEGDYLFLPHLYNAENVVASILRKKIEEQSRHEKKSDQIDEWIDTFESEHNWMPDMDQRRAIKAANETACLLLTGGPGTGKTTVLKVIVKYFQAQFKKVLLTAPTGRAAQRIKEVTGVSAQTVHRLLEYQPQSDRTGYVFKRNEQNPLEGDIVIVDEVSMMDILLMSNLCKAIPEHAHLVLVGDHEQLPSVGPGNILRDLIASGVVPHIHLSNIFRQAASSRIISAAHEINRGVVPVFQNGKNDNCFFIDSNDPDTVLNQIIDLVARRLPSTYSFDPPHDIQVLSPMHKGILGTENLNIRLQAALRRSSKKIASGKNIFYLGEKVMQIKNNYDKNVFNGDIGFICEIIDDAGVVIDFQGNKVSYDVPSLEEVQSAYCISIHKSQGSEFKAVVIPLVTQHYIMLQRNLIYTALTRAKQLCVFIGSRRALRIAVETNNVAERYSNLKNRLRGADTSNV